MNVGKPGGLSLNLNKPGGNNPGTSLGNNSSTTSSLTGGGLGSLSTGLKSTSNTPSLLGNKTLGGGLLGKSNAPVEKKDIPEALKDKTVAQALEYFESQLEQQVQTFQSQARQIARWDRSIYECISLMQHLETQIKTVEDAQKELSTSANQLLTEQKAFIEELKKKSSTNTSDSTDQRQRLYRLARELNTSFLEMEKQLKDIYEKTEINTNMESTSDIGKIEHIANCHLDSLRWIEHQSNILEEKLDKLSKRISNN